MKQIIVLFVVFSMVNIAHAQDYNFGIRAGLNYAKFLGPSIDEANHKETFSLNNGIHFAITYAYNLSDRVSLNSEIAYSQIGSRYKYEGDSYYIFKYQNGRHPLPGKAERIFDINNSYISIPLLFSFKPTPKWEFQVGPYVQFLVISRGTSQLTFTSPNEDLNPYSFKQSTDANYFSDKPGAAARSNEVVRVCLSKKSAEDETCPDDQIVAMPRIVGGYYEFDDKDKAGNLYNWFDTGLSASASYFVNGSLYLRLTGQYGLLDVTNNDVDVDYRKLNDENRFIFQKDKDVNLNFAVSLGFKF